MSWTIDFNKTKNILLKEIRGVGFEELLEKGEILDNLKHHNTKKYPHQRILVIKWKNYVYTVPYVIDKNKKTFFLKTLYPSRVLRKQYLKRRNNV